MLKCAFVIYYLLFFNTVGELRHLLLNPNVLVAFSKDTEAVKLCTNKNPPVLNWRCWLMQADLYTTTTTV